MKERKVLIVGMLDSIHMARWLQQFETSDLEFFLFPSRKFRTIHPLILDLVARNPKNFKLSLMHRSVRFAGYIDFLFFEISSMRFSQHTRRNILNRIVRRNNFDYVHALEIQSAGYLCSALDLPRRTHFILTNWGSDIYFFKNNPEDLRKIRLALSKANSYSAECIRDYELAKRLGFHGIELPCIPNSGGFLATDFPIDISAVSTRHQIIVKTYGGVFGRGDLAIEAVSQLMEVDSSWDIVFYSVTDDLIDSVTSLVTQYPGRIRWYPQAESLSRNDLLFEFSKSCIYLGCSRSDGISTSFLEAAAMGVFPIQTDTSCADEWVKKGIFASVVPCNIQEIARALVNAANDFVGFDERCLKNSTLVREELAWPRVKEIAMTFYG